ncbi:MAG: hypothetical protein ACOYL5_20395 [Phototrophicaceae bacterium]|jgi:hypothetical protein
MMYQTTWANDQQTTVYMALSGDWHADHIVDAHRSVHTMLSEVGHPVSIVVHIQQPRAINTELMTQLRAFIGMDHPNRDKIVIVAPTVYMKGVGEIIRRLFGGEKPTYLIYADDLNHAETALMSA